MNTSINIRELQRRLQRILEELANSLNADVATLWLYDVDTNEFGLPIRYGVRRPHLPFDPILRPGTRNGGDLIVDNKKPEILSNITGNQFMDGPFARREGIISSAGFPLIHEDRVVGVLFISYRQSHEFSKDEIRIIQDAVKQVSPIIAETNVFELLHQLNPQKNKDTTLGAVTDLAFRILRRPVAIWLLEPQKSTLRIRAMTGFTQEYFDNASAKLGDDSMISQVLEKSQQKVTSSTTQYAIKAGWPATLGIPIEIQGKTVGVIEVLGTNCNNLKEIDHPTLHHFAKVASVAIDNARQSVATQLLLESIHTIENAIDPLMRLDKTLNKVSQKIQQSQAQQFDLVAIQLIDLEKRIIETVYGTGIAKDWAFVAKHPLNADKDVQDIQADVVLSDPPRIEVISGWDDRFDWMIYDRYKHRNFVRAWVPMIVVRESNGNVLVDWFEHARWEVTNNEPNYKDGKIKGWHVALQLQLKGLYDSMGQCWSERIGTIEVGYRNLDTKITPEQATHLITPEQANDLAKRVSQYALEIHKCLLPYVLETIAETARHILEADYSTLFLFFDQDRGHYVYKVRSGEVDHDFIERNPPSQGGLGQQAIEAREPRFRDKFYLRKFNKSRYEQGVRAMAAFPLLINQTQNDKNRNQGILYIYFNKAHEFTQDEISWVKLLASRAVDAIRHVTYYTETRDNARRLANLHDAAESIVINQEICDLLDRIAGNTRNILTADLVTIYEYTGSEKKFLTPPTVAGRFKVPDKMMFHLERESPPEWLIEKGKDLYEEYAERNPNFCTPHGINAKGEENFVIREGIKSVAGILLRAGQEIVGVMFVNYLRHHVFSPDERSLIEMLASTAAIAIQNRHLLEKRNQD